MAEMFPKMTATTIAEAAVGRIVAIDTHTTTALAIVVAIGDAKRLLLLTPQETKFVIERVPENREIVVIDNEIRISFDPSWMTRMEGFYEDKSLGFLLPLPGRGGVIICAENDGFGRESTLVGTADWQVLSDRPRLRVGTHRWWIEAYDESSSSWTRLFTH